MPDIAPSAISVPTQLKSLFRLLDSTNAPAYLRSGAAKPPSAAMQDSVGQSSQSADPVLRAIAELDRKLDAVIGLLQREALHADFPLEGRVAALSSSGLTLESKERLEPGCHMELVLLSDDYYSRNMSVMAEVTSVRQEEARLLPGGLAYDLTYIGLSEEDEDAIIRFIFSEERKRIRQQKG